MADAITVIRRHDRGQEFEARRWALKLGQLMVSFGLWRTSPSRRVRHPRRGPAAGHRRVSRVDGQRVVDA